MRVNQATCRLVRRLLPVVSCNSRSAVRSAKVDDRLYATAILTVIPWTSTRNFSIRSGSFRLFMLGRPPTANAPRPPTPSVGSPIAWLRSRSRIRQLSIAFLSRTPGRGSSSWHCSDAMGCARIVTSDSAGTRSWYESLRRSSTSSGRSLSSWICALRAPQRGRREGHRGIHLPRHVRCRRGRRTAHGLDRRLADLDRPLPDAPAELAGPLLYRILSRGSSRTARGALPSPAPPE